MRTAASRASSEGGAEHGCGANGKEKYRTHVGSGFGGGGGVDGRGGGFSIIKFNVYLPRLYLEQHCHIDSGVEWHRI